mgnify:CR=1 FL=1
MQEIIQESQSSSSGNKKKSFTTSIPIKAFFNACLHNWYWFVISAIICTCVALLKSKSEPKLYSSSATIMLTTENSKQAGSQVQIFGDLGTNMGTSDVGNETHKIKSTKLMENVVEHLGLNIQYYGKVYLREVNTYKSSPVQITPMRETTSNYSISIAPKSETKFEFAINGSNDWKEAEFGNTVATPYGPIAVTKTKLFNTNYVGYTVIAKVYTVNSAAKKYIGTLKVERTEKWSDVLKLSLVTDNNELGIDILNALIVAYNQDAIEDKNRVARNTEDFIAERIAAISQDLSGVDSRIAQLKSASANSAMYADASSGIRFQENASDANLQLSIATSMQGYINSTDDKTLLPSNVGIADAGIEGQIKAYNDNMLKYQKIASTATGENPVIAQLQSEMSAQRANIQNSINKYINKLSAQTSRAQAQASTAQAGRQVMPEHEKAIIEVSRQQNVKEQLFLYLLNKREENALQIAITEPNAKVIESATGSGSPISPNTSRFLAIGLLIGLLIPAAILYLIYWILSLDTKIHSRHDVEENCKVPIVGEIPSKHTNQKNDEIVISENSVDRVSEALRIVRANLDFIAEGKDGTGIVMQFTSTRPGEGKSFIALNLALTYAYVNKKVAVVDLDLRKGRFSEYAKTDTNLGVSSYLSGKISNIDDIIVKGSIHENLDIVPLGAIPPNPTGLLMNKHLEELINTLRTRYDYIVLDTVPYGLIADASLINRYVDFTVYVIRDGFIDKKFLLELEKASDDKKLKNLTIVINDVKIGKKNYGYGGYSYGYGYGYENYGYGYGSEESSKKKFSLKNLKSKIKKH